MGSEELPGCIRPLFPALATDAAIVSIGSDFIEVVSRIPGGTTAGRLIEKRGDGGYMIIMQTEDAKKRREYIEAKGLSRVISEQDLEDSVSVQYHPKGVKGGMGPELDSHVPGPNNPTPVQSRFSPWHACGSDMERYTTGMKRTLHLTLEGCVLRLQPGDLGHEAAARQWEDIFGIARSRDLLAFTNARLGFIPGRKGQPEGLVSITISIKGKDAYDAISERAGDDGIDMCGAKWYLALTGHSTPPRGNCSSTHHVQHAIRFDRCACHVYWTTCRPRCHPKTVEIPVGALLERHYPTDVIRRAS